MIVVRPFRLPSGRHGNTGRDTLDGIPNRWGGEATESGRANARSFWYWSGTVYAPSPSNAWNFNTNNGNQNNDDNIINNNGYVWPVRPGER